MNRRVFLASATVAAGSLALPARVFAQPSGLDAKSTAILDIARREVARAADYLWYRDIAAIADFGVHSAVPRFHFVNLEAGTVSSFLVTHGSGSDIEHDGWLKQFSNVPGSLATSRGAYVTQEWYVGRYGTSLRLAGLDPDNSHALNRAIVMHPAEYARPEHIDRWGRLGRSQGCFAMAPDDFRFALMQIYGGRLLYADRLGLA
jgi:hypothetical protein